MRVEYPADEDHPFGPPTDTEQDLIGIPKQPSMPVGGGGEAPQGTTEDPEGDSLSQLVRILSTNSVTTKEEATHKGILDFNRRNKTNKDPDKFSGKLQEYPHWLKMLKSNMRYNCLIHVFYPKTTQLSPVQEMH